MRKVFEVDGYWHEVGSLRCCGGKKCLGCGGVIHYQGLYGEHLGRRAGSFEECDGCGRSLPRLHRTAKTLQQLNAIGN